jgi:hypothetical protein
MVDPVDEALRALLSAIPGSRDDAAMDCVIDGLRQHRSPEKYVQRGTLLLRHARAIKCEKSKQKGPQIAAHVAEKLLRYHEDMAKT